MSAWRMMVTYLHRLVGAKLVVKLREVKEDNLTLDMGEVVSVRFMNRGEFPVMIDNQILLYTNESYVEGDSAGHGIKHTYKIEFQKANPDRTPLGGANRPFVYAGKHLSVRTLHRQY